MLAYKKELLDNIDKYAELYLNGASYAKITELIGGSSTRAIGWVSKTFKEYGIEKRSASDQNRNRFGYTLNKNAFDTDFSDETSSYFLGFILADGSLSMDRLSITIKQEDGYILKKLQEFLGMNYGYRESSVFDKRTLKRYYRATLGLKDAKIISDLNAQNIFKNKSAEEKLPNIDWRSNRHFWRGVVDGDGHVKALNGAPAVLVLVGSEEIVNGFIEFADINVGFITKRPAVPVKQKNKILYHVQITGDDARNIAKFLYKDSSIRLERKYNKTLCKEEEDESNPNSAD